MLQTPGKRLFFHFPSTPKNQVFFFLLKNFNCLCSRKVRMVRLQNINQDSIHGLLRIIKKNILICQTFEGYVFTRQLKTKLTNQVIGKILSKQFPLIELLKATGKNPETFSLLLKTWLIKRIFKIYVFVQTSIKFLDSKPCF